MNEALRWPFHDLVPEDIAQAWALVEALVQATPPSPEDDEATSTAKGAPPDHQHDDGRSSTTAVQLDRAASSTSSGAPSQSSSSFPASYDAMAFSETALRKEAQSLLQRMETADKRIWLSRRLYRHHRDRTLSANAVEHLSSTLVTF